MKILVVSEAPVPSLNRSYRSDPLAKYLSAMGHDVSVVCPRATCIKDYESIKFFHLPEHKYEKYNLTSRYKFLNLLKKRVEELLREEEFDVIRAVSFAAGFATVAANAKKPPVITNLSDFYSDLYRQFELPLSIIVSRIFKRMERRIVEGSALFIVDAPVQRTCWKDWGLETKRCVVLPNGVNRELFNQKADGKRIRENYGIDETSKVIFYHGDMSKLDGVDILIEASPKIVKANKNVKFMLVGAGTEKYMGKLRALIKEKGVNDSFIFTGWVPYIQVPQYIAAADVCVAPFRITLTSDSNLPNKVIEYIAIKKPIVTTECRGIKEMIGDTPEYISPENSDMLFKAIDHILTNGVEEEKLEQMERIADRLDWKNIVKHEEKIITSLLNHKIEDYKVLDHKLL